MRAHTRLAGCVNACGAHNENQHGTAANILYSLDSTSLQLGEVERNLMLVLVELHIVEEGGWWLVSEMGQQVFCRERPMIRRWMESCRLP